MSVTSPARRFAPIAVVAALSLALSGCSGADSGDDKKDADCTEYKSGAVSDGVKVSGAFGEDGVTAEFDTLDVPEQLQRTTVITGDGEIAKPGDEVSIQLTLFNGTTGETILTESALLPVGEPQLPEELSASVECLPIGSRTVVAISADQMLNGQGATQLGVEPGQIVVIVADLINFFAPKEWTEGKATVTFDGENPPTLTLPSVDPSPELLLEVLEEGDGDVLNQGDTFTANYQGTKWSTGEIFDQSYGKGTPLTAATGQVVKGFSAAMVGQRVGSKLVVSIPPRFAYGESPDQHELGGETLVFVIELLKAEPAA